MKERPIPVPIIFYHSAAPKKNPAWVRNYLTLELKYFQDHLRLFTGLKMQTQFLDTYIHLKKDSEILTLQNQENIFITFDDGFLDNWIYVFPLLKKYNVKATIFVNPEFVDTRHPVRKNLEDYWNNKAGLKEIDRWGYLSWEEMRLMEASGLVDIQSHTLTHTKYIVSTKITGFHRPGSDCLHVIGNLFPEKKPYYIEDPSFECSIPYGYPLFEEASAMIARKITINEDFSREVIESLRGINWYSPLESEPGRLYQGIKEIYNQYRERNRLVIARETEKQYRTRVTDEIRCSKEIIEKELHKRVSFCCWPFGDTNDYAHQKAMDFGFLATTTGKQEDHDDHDDHDDNFQYHQKIPPRIGLGVCRDNRPLTVLKALYKIKSFQKHYPYYGVKRIYEGLQQWKKREARKLGS